MSHDQKQHTVCDLQRVMPTKLITQEQCTQICLLPKRYPNTRNPLSVTLYQNIAPSSAKSGLHYAAACPLLSLASYDLIYFLSMILRASLLSIIQGFLVKEGLSCVFTTVEKLGKARNIALPRLENPVFIKAEFQTLVHHKL